MLGQCPDILHPMPGSFVQAFQRFSYTLGQIYPLDNDPLTERTTEDRDATRPLSSVEIGFQ